MGFHRRAYGPFRFSDISYNGCKHTIGTEAIMCHHSGAFANQNYTAQIVYVAGTNEF
jgi:hypothetical protein